MKGYIKVGAFLVVILATILWLGGFLSKKERLKAVEQQSQIVSGLGFDKAQEINTYTYHSGQIVADKRLEISTKIPGRVLSVNVEQSQQVSKGQSLLNIDPGEIIAQARAFEYQKVQSEKLELSLRAQL
ncbi:MAG: biotin/lipoyl-binding protein, partial [Aquificaceae bacterium]